MSRRVIGFVGALILAIVGMVVLLGYLKTAEDRALEGEEVIDVYVATESIDQGTSAADIADRVRLERIPAKIRLDDAIVSLDELDGLVASIDLRPGEQISRSRFVLPQSLTGFEGPDLDIPDTFVEVTVFLSPTQAVGGTFAPGDLVSIIASFEPFDVSPAPLPDGTVPLVEVDGALVAADESTPATTDLLLQNVLVTNVQIDETPPEDEDRQEQASGLTPAPTSAFLVTVALSPLDAERLVFASTFGSVWFAAEGPAVTDADTFPQTRSYIFADIAPGVVETLPPVAEDTQEGE